jgi:hypothetical protein
MNKKFHTHESSSRQSNTRKDELTPLYVRHSLERYATWLYYATCYLVQSSRSMGATMNHGEETRTRDRSVPQMSKTRTPTTHRWRRWSHRPTMKNAFSSPGMLCNPRFQPEFQANFKLVRMNPEFRVFFREESSLPSLELFGKFIFHPKNCFCFKRP